MATRIRYNVDPEYVKPKLEDLEIPTIDYTQLVGSTDLKDDTRPPDESDSESPAAVEGAGYTWRAWGLNNDLSDVEEIVTATQKFLEVVDKITKILTAVVKLIQVFSSDFKSIGRLLKILLKVVVKKLKEIIDGLSSTGIYSALIFPPFSPRVGKFSFPVNGGYREFTARVKNLCLDSKDEDAPKFGANDAVGGLIIAMIGGTGDPDFLQDLITNFKVLAKLFRFRNPMPAPAKNIMARAGFFRDPDDRKKVKLGIKVSWEHPGTPLTGFVLKRSKSKSGYVVEEKNTSGIKERIHVFKDKEFDGEGVKQFNVIIGRPKYHYIDFDVEDSKTYYYKVYTTTGYNFYDENPFFQRIESPTATKTVFATPRNKIPLSELASETVLDENGNRVYGDEFDGEWQSLSIRSLLGPEIDKLFGHMDRLSEKLLGMVSTSGDAMSDYLDFFKKKIKFYMDIVNMIADIIIRLAQYRLSGTFMLLTIEPDKGGMEGFFKKYNSAVMTEDVKGLQIGTKKKDNSYSMKSLNDRGIMAGVILLYGFPKFDEEYLSSVVPESELDAFSKSLDDSKKALSAFTKLLGLES